MKWLALWMFAGSAAMAAGGPGDAALAFLQSLTEEEAIFAIGDTAISPEVSEVDRANMATRLGRLGKSIRPGDLRIVEEKQDGDLAAVLISQVAGFDSTSLQIHAVGVVKSADKWLPTPLPSSFDSTGISLRPGFLSRAKALEEWMLRKRGELVIRLKDDILSQLQAEMRKAKSPDDLHESKPEALAEDFLKALAERNLPAALAIAGGLEEQRPDDWEEIFRVLGTTLRSERLRHRWWRLMAAPDAVRAVVHADQDEDEALVSVVGIDPAGNFGSRPRPQAIHLRFLRNARGMWRLTLPQQLLEPAENFGSPGREDDDAVDGELYEMLPGKLRAVHPPVREKDARSAARAVLAALADGSLAPLISRLDLSGEGLQSLPGLVSAASLWQRLHLPEGFFSAVLLDVHEMGDEAVALFQLFSAKAPEQARIETLFFQKGADGGWLANSGLSGTAGLGAVKDHKAFAAWLDGALKAREASWSEGVLSRIGGIAADSAPTAEEARKTVLEWRKAAAAGNGARMLELSACFDDAAGTTHLLRNIGYEILTRQAGEPLEVHRSGRWAAVTMRVPPAPEDDSADAYPLFIVAATPEGPRVMAELDLFDPLTRSREFLNRRVWERVGTRLPDGARGELEAIYEKHRTISAADRERRQKSEE